MSLLHSAPTVPPPGWYADPWRVAALRWWNGNAWTADVQGPWGYAVPLAPRPQPGASRYDHDGGEARVRPSLAITVAVLCIVAGVIYQAFVYGLNTDSTTTSSDYLLRQDLVIGLGFYLVVGAGMVLFVRTQKVRLVWHRGSPASSVVIGALCGLSAGVLIVAANSSLVGHTASDPRIELLVSEGGIVRIALTFILTAVLAPLVEETLFRGVVAGSLVGRSVGLAVVVSAIAFAVWHLNITSLRYYAIMGVLIAVIWLKRGLIGSMTAHACFNAFLTVVAVVVTQTGGSTATVGALSVRVPAGWQTVISSYDTYTATGPSAASLLIGSDNIPVDPSTGNLQSTVDQLLANATSSPLSDVVDQSTERAVTTGAGPGIEVDLHDERGPAHSTFVVADGQLYEITVRTQGSPRAEADYAKMLRSASIG